MQNNTICIVAHSFLTSDGRNIQIGGVQTYVDALCHLLASMNVYSYVLQLSDRPFINEISSHITVVGVGPKNTFLKKEYICNHRGKHTLTIFATFAFAVWNNGERYVAIQHGVSWDGFWSRHKGINLFVHKYYQHYLLFQNKRDVKYILNTASKIICVDSNFPNWVRSAFPFDRWEEKLIYVPNFGNPISPEQLNSKLASDNPNIRIIIARRFEEFRGVLLIAKVVQNIASYYPNAHFLFSGTGSCKNRLLALLETVPNANVLSLSYNELQLQHIASSISVIPTLWSEGTSLSCIEAMCAGSTPLSTNVGGLSNIIISGYNGLLVEPTFDSLKNGLRFLLDNPEVRLAFAHNAYRTASIAFSLDRWNRQMLGIIKPLLD